MTDEPATDTPPTGQDDDTARIAQILAVTFDADNHDTLDADITRLMLDLSAEMKLDRPSHPADATDGLRTAVKAILMALRGSGPVSG